MIKQNSIKVSINIIFVGMIIAFAFIIIVFNYQNGLKNSYELSYKIIQQTTQNIIEKSNYYLHKNDRSLEILTNANKSNNIYFNEHFNINAMWHLLQKEEHIASIFLADKHKNFIQVRREPKLALRKIYLKDEKRVDHYFYKDINQNILSETTKIAIYDPTIRPWYQNTKDKKIYVSKPYIFDSTKKMGITISYGNIDNNGQKVSVGALDITLDNLTSFVIEQAKKIKGDIYIIDAQSNLITSSIEKLNQSLSLKREINKKDFLYYKIFENDKNHKEVNSIKNNKQKYLYKITKLKVDETKEWEVLVVVPEDIALGRTKEILMIAVFVSLIFVLIFVLIATKFASMLSKPIKRLSEDIESLKNLETNIELVNDSKIKEIKNAQNSLISLRSGLESFKKYMPVDLVKLLINTKQEAKIGGSEQKLAVMFTDIESFTTISEKLTPKELTEQLSEYFDKLEKIISKNEGTIDKYIGDAIMAFWGAPIKIEKPLSKAVLCALEIQDELEKLNQVWEKEGKARLNTRIGIHYGPTLVGNIGSRNRMNYTIMGDTVNIASRLESINKNYATKIMLSEEVYNILEDKFEMKYIDEMKLKGKTESTKIYTVFSKK